ncbi:MAG: hypothetical protein ACLQVD_20440 [Capsulimonadaceae bacterium]
MPVFIIAGYQRSLENQLRRALSDGAQQWSGWQYVLFPGNQHKTSSVSLTQVNDLCELAAKHNGAHVFAVSEDPNRKEMAAKIRPYFRFRWIGASEIRDVGRGVFNPVIDSLRQATQEEDFWIEHVKPRNFASPLILPVIFKADKHIVDMWRFSESYNNNDNLRTAEALIERFKAEHRRKVDGFKKTPWLDHDLWIWDDNGQRHGIASFPKDWKYSLRLPDGFHFDVSSQGLKRTSFTDIHGTQHRMPKGYLNVSAHGEVRGTGSTSSQD